VRGHLLERVEFGSAHGAEPTGEEVQATGRVRLSPELDEGLLVIPGPGPSSDHVHTALQSAGLAPGDRGTLQPKELGAFEALIPFRQQAPVLLFAHLVDGSLSSLETWNLS